jgi:hypothetical protein
MSAQPSPFAAPWPAGAIARYLTVGGAHVDLTHKFTVTTPPEAYATLAACTGCPDSQEFSHHRLVWGLTAQHEARRPKAADREARAWAQAHAERCRALPRPEATR